MVSNLATSPEMAAFDYHLEPCSVQGSNTMLWLQCGRECSPFESSDLKKAGVNTPLLLWQIEAILLVDCIVLGSLNFYAVQGAYGTSILGLI